MNNSNLHEQTIVGLAGFEPTTSCPPDKRANQAALQPVLRVYEKRLITLQVRYKTRAPRSILKCHGAFASASVIPASSRKFKFSAVIFPCALGNDGVSPQLGQDPSAVIAVGVKYFAHGSHQGMTYSALRLTRNLMGVDPNLKASRIERSRYRR